MEQSPPQGPFSVNNQIHNNGLCRVLIVMKSGFTMNEG